MKTVLISLAILASASAFANEAADDRANREAFAGVATRAEVQSGYLRARAAGTLVPTDETASLRAPAAPDGGQARDDVRREARQAARQRVIHELL
ncbi:hypothetical protein RAMLITH_21980 [Ramlibacter sp. RBP-2]|uniref:DUF4148 domain-containing protein n=1 Tax=Ramlibacter lithotrophicus TaxID=2606681 RepID=A0A7X6DJU1_9BURK|nr:hypothetical protein [Ramlibacter lithotrophicus]NKE68492.1 hypothetical protein [Ramlibacter lithotrophicus]